ncbi:MAG: hypothetical protein QXW94_05035 [Desulfurococcaceae archaeon]
MEQSWRKELNISKYRDGVYSVCVSGDRVYAVGFDESLGLGIKRYRAEAFNTRNGDRVASWADDQGHHFASLFTCRSSGNYIYAFGATEGFWSAIAFNKDLQVVKRADFENPYLMPFSCLFVDKHIYIAGTFFGPEVRTSASFVKLNSENLSIINGAEFETDILESGAYALAYSSGNKYIVAGGFTRTRSSIEWYIQLLDENLKFLDTIKPSVKGTITGIAVDLDGFIYAVDGYRVAKLDSKGKLIQSVDKPSGTKILASEGRDSPLSGNIAVASNEGVYLLSRDKLSVVDSWKLSTTGAKALSPLLGSMGFDQSNLYLPLVQIESDTKWNWVVLALKPKSRGIFTRIFGKK